MSTTRTRSTAIGVGAAVLVAAAGTVGGYAAAHASNATPTATTTSTAGAMGTAGPRDRATARKHARAGALTALKGVQHAQWVTAGKDGAYVTHDAIRGSVTAVSPTSVTVRADDGVSQTYAVSATTKVSLSAAKHGRADSTSAAPSTPMGGATTPSGPHGGSRGSVSDVSDGDQVLVTGTGTGTGTLTAERILVPQG